MRRERPSVFRMLQRPRTLVVVVVSLLVVGALVAVVVKSLASPGAQQTSADATNSSNPSGAITPSATSSAGSDASPTPSTSTTSAEPPAGPGAFPTRSSVGLPAGWQPAREIRGEFWIDEEGAVIEDVRFVDAEIHVDAPNVTLRRIQAVATHIVNDDFDVCKNGLLIEDSEFIGNDRQTTDHDLWAIGTGGYTMRNVAVDDVPEGLRVGAKGYGCGPVVVENSYIRVVPPDVCDDWHGDGIQGYDGDHLTVRNATVILVETNGCFGTAAFFYPENQDNTSIDIDGLLVEGGGYVFRNQMPGSVRNLAIVDGSWGYGPLDVRCELLTSWDAQIVRMENGQAVPVRPLPCN
jgi:hypothetical protein